MYGMNTNAITKVGIQRLPAAMLIGGVCLEGLAISRALAEDPPDYVGRLQKQQEEIADLKSRMAKLKQAKVLASYSQQ